ncbi:MAG: DUF3107 domain-containing protein [Streptosporangiaceae bacterium]
MEVRIGVQSLARELVLETSTSADEIQRALVEALARDKGVFTLADDHGRTVLVPIDKLGYVEIDEPEPHQVGFGTL